MYEKIKKAAIGSMLAASLCGGSANAQTYGSVEGIVSAETGNSYVRPSVAYQLPYDFKGFSFAELYKEGYLGSSVISRKLNDNVDLMFKHYFSDKFDSKIAAGLSVNKDIYGVNANAYALPFVADKNSQLESMALGYRVSKELPWGMNVSGFGEASLSRKGLTWGYGELSLDKKLTDNLTISYVPALYNSGAAKLTPNYEHRVSAKWTF